MPTNPDTRIMAPRQKRAGVPSPADAVAMMRRDPRALNSAKDPEDLKAAMIYIRLTADERNHWIGRANKAKQTLTDFIRAAVAAYVPKKKALKSTTRPDR